ncbi:MAG: SpoIID/LytB domain-containing protein [Synechococcaceae cyanobacterium]|nr:SpoIID/LytB domain-containing protein [Synechococcaceae cyanobacterium]
MPVRLPQRRLMLPSSLALAVAPLLAGGCQAIDAPPALAPPPADGAILHWPVPEPAPLSPAAPVLWVALASRLGPPPDSAAGDAAPPLRLRSAGSRPLALIAADGRRVSAAELVLHWRWQTLPQPQLLRRQVLGPFASFESAERVAALWRRQGVAATIAHPREWEVWAAAGTPPPDGMTARPLERRETRRAVLELQRPTGALTLQGPLRIEAPDGLRWREGVFAGPFRLQSDAHGGWSLIEQVPLERYLEGVLPHEIGAGAPAAALEAQAVLARTWAMRNSHRFAVDGYHLCSDTQCQVYADPRLAGAAVRQAIGRSRGKVLSWNGEPIHAVYHASNGGIAAGFDEVWNASPLPYLKPFVDAPEPVARRLPLPVQVGPLATLLKQNSTTYGADHPLYRWQRLLTAADVAQALSRSQQGVGEVQRLEVVARGPSGRVLTLRIRGSKGTRLLSRDAIRRTLRQVPSTLFLLEAAGPGRWRLVGGGFGHGAGLSQAGAVDLARRGWTTQRILSHYYPQTELRGTGELKSSGIPGEAP